METKDLTLVDVKSLVLHDKITTLAILRWYYLRMEEDNLLDSLFYDDPVETAELFQSIALDNGNLFMLMLDKRTNMPFGHIHCNGFEGLVCRLHFCFLRIAHGRGVSKAMGLEALRQFFNCRRGDTGLPVATGFMGLTPISNRLACRYVLSLGCEKIAIIDNACYIRKLDKHVPGMLTYCTPDRLVD